MSWKHGAAEGPLDRALAILGFVSSQRKAVTLAEIAVALGYPLPSVHRLASNLEERRLLGRVPGSRRLVIGAAMVELGAKAVGAAFRTTRRHAILQEVARRLGEQLEVGLVRDGAVTYVDSVSVDLGPGLRFDPGVRAPLHCTSTGKLYLSTRPAGERERLVRDLALERFTDRTITDPDELLAEVARVRDRGHATSDEEFVRGVVGCAVPIFGKGRTLIACLGVSVPVARMSHDGLGDLIVPLQEAARRLSSALTEETVESSDEDAAATATA